MFTTINQLISQPVFDDCIFIGPNALTAGPVLLQGNLFINAHSITTKSVSRDVVLSNANAQSELLDVHKQELKIF